MSLRLTRNQFLHTLLAAIVLLSSCSKNDDHHAGNDPIPQKKISRLYQDPNNFLEFIYNPDGTLGKVRLAEEDLGNEIRTLDVSYGDNKRIANIYLGDGTHIHYRYENGKLIATETKDANGYIQTSGSYYYENGNLVDYGSFLPFPLDDGQSGVSYKRVQESRYSYNSDKTINTITTNLRNPFTNKMELSGRRRYEKYDNKINPMKFLPDFSYGFFQELNPSNIVKEIAYDAEGVVTETIDRTYTYDSHGYPLTCTEKTTEPGKTPVTKTLTFSYR
jgi:hypothetical protein